MESFGLCFYLSTKYYLVNVNCLITNFPLIGPGIFELLFPCLPYSQPRPHVRIESGRDTFEGVISSNWTDTFSHTDPPYSTLEQLEQPKTPCPFTAANLAPGWIRSTPFCTWSLLHILNPFLISTYRKSRTDEQSPILGIKPFMWLPN